MNSLDLESFCNGDLLVGRRRVSLLKVPNIQAYPESDNNLIGIISWSYKNPSKVKDPHKRPFV